MTREVEDLMERSFGDGSNRLNGGEKHMRKIAKPGTEKVTLQFPGLGTGPVPVETTCVSPEYFELEKQRQQRGLETGVVSSFTLQDEEVMLRHFHKVASDAVQSWCREQGRAGPRLEALSA